MKKFFKIIGILCTCFVVYCMCEVLLDDDSATTTTETADNLEEIDDEYDDEYDDEEDDEDNWTVDEQLKEIKEELNLNDKETEEIVASILKALKEAKSDTDNTTTASATKPGETKKTDNKPTANAKPAETKPTETKPAETKPTETKPAETKPADNKPAQAAPAATNRKVNALTVADFKKKIADFSTSKTAAKKGVNAVVLIYHPADNNCNKMYESMTSLANEFPKIDLYAMKFQESLDIVKAYEAKQLPLLIVARNGKVELKTGYLKLESLRAFLQDLK